MAPIEFTRRMPPSLGGSPLILYLSALTLLISPTEWSKWNVSLRLAVAPRTLPGAPTHCGAEHETNVGAAWLEHTLGRLNTARVSWTTYWQRRSARLSY